MDLVTHEHPALGLIISIEPDRVVYDISLANGFLNTLIPRERGLLKLRLEENTFIFLNPDQEESERSGLAEFFNDLPPIRINGPETPAQFDQFEFVRSSASADLAESGLLPPDARVRIIYPSARPPTNVELHWNIFTDTYSVDVFGDPVEPILAARLDTNDQSRIVKFARDKPTVAWSESSEVPQNRMIAFEPQGHNKSIPLLSIVILVIGFGGYAATRKTVTVRRFKFAMFAIVIAAALFCRNSGAIELSRVRTALWARSPEAFATTTLKSLLQNIYRAFDFRNESDVYDVLAQSVDGPLLDEVYREIYRTLIAPEQNGAVTKVKSFEMLHANVVEPVRRENNEFEIAGRWQVDGMVYHWGHVHDTSSIFEAIYTVAPRDGFWKIIKTEMKTATPDT